MATDLEQKPIAPATVKIESYVAQELEKVRGRVRLLDAGGWLLLFLIATLGYGLVLALVDRAFDLSLAARLISFVLYLGAAGFCLVQAGLCLLRRVNPYYAARQLEQTLPDTKNSIINWLDLRDEKLPPAIRSALGTRAARDLKHADPERAVPSRVPLLLGAVVLGLVLALLVLFVMENNRFGDLMGRAFAPFGDIDLGTQTTITVLQPEDGNVEVAINRPVHFRARIEGRVPPVNQKGAPRLLYRYNPAEPYDDKVGLPLEEDRDGTWFATMVGDQVQTGFWYKITAGDAQTPEYQVSVRTFPLVTRYEATYHYRPYRKIPDQSTVFPNENAASPSLKAHRGTEVTLIARTNRKLRDGRLEFTLGDARRDVAGEVLADDPQALRLKFIMEKSGTFRVLFTSKENEENSNPSPFPIDVLDDGVPTVQLTKPGKDVELEANRSLPVEGSASDDFGIKQLILRLRVVEGPEKPALAPLVYRENKSFQLDDGSYPRTLEYSDLIKLTHIKTDKGAAFPVAKGMILEYWLEVTDGSDYPNKEGNVGRSKVFKITILDPDKDEKKVEQERRQAEKRQEKHNQEQDNKIDKENEAKKGEQPPQNNNPEQDQQNKDELDKTRERLNKDAKELDDARKQQERDKQPGQAKGGEPEKSEPKKGGEQPNGKSPGEVKDQKPENQEKAGEQKNDGASGQGDKAGQARDGGKKEERSPAQSRDAQNQPPAAAKGGGEKQRPEGKQTNPSEAAGAKQPPKDNPTTARDQGPKSDQNPARAKESGKDDMGQPRAENKQPGKEQPGTEAKNERGSDSAGQSQTAKAEQKKGRENANDQVAQAKDQGADKGKHTPETGASKTGEEKMKGGEGPSTAKQGDPPERKGIAKQTKETGAGGQPKAETKPAGASAKNAEPQAQPKHIDPKEAEKIAQAKDRGTPDPKDQLDPNEDKAREHLAKLAEKLNSTDKKEREEALKALDEMTKNLDKLASDDHKTRTDATKDLEKMAKETKDPDVREAVKNILERAKRDAQAKGSDNPETKTAQGERKSGEADSQKRPPAEAKDNPKGKEPGKDDTGSAKSDNPPSDPQYVANVKKGNPQPQGGNYGPHGAGLRHDPRAWDPTAAFTRKGGELNLDELKEKITPEMRKAAGWTEERWRTFLKDAEAYNRELAKLRQQTIDQEGKNTAQGGTTRLPSTGPRPVRASDSNASGAQVGQPQPPLEFRDLYQTLTRPDAAPPKK